MVFCTALPPEDYTSIILLDTKRVLGEDVFIASSLLFIIFLSHCEINHRTALHIFQSAFFWSSPFYASLCFVGFTT